MKRAHRKAHLVAWLVITPLLLVLLLAGAGRFKSTQPPQPDLPGIDNNGSQPAPKGALP